MSDTIVFYRDWYDAISELPPEERVQAYDAVFLYAFKGETPTNKLIRGITALMRSAIDRDSERYQEICKARSEAGKKGMAKRWGNKGNSDNKSYQPITTDNKNNHNDNKNDNENVNDNDNKNDNENKNIVYPYQDIAALWKEICPMLPQIKKLNTNRRLKIKTRLHEFGDNPKEWLAFVRDLFARVAASSFLRGENNHNWVCTFDWLFENEKNWVKVIEGNYDDNKGTRAARQQQQATLGVSEWIDESGQRRYGTGRYTVPMSAPPRPSERHGWDEASQNWILL